MKIIGLTGGIGSGKSTVTDYLTSKGFHVLDADKVAREIVMPGSEMLIRLSSIFGTDILHEDGSLNRKKLGEIIFLDHEKKKILDELMHTRILEIIHDRIFKIREEYNHSAKSALEPDQIKNGKVIFIDAPLLFETGLDKSVGETWVIDVDDETRIQRIMKRDGLNREEIMMRINTQMTREEKNQRADVLLDNTGDEQALYKQIDRMLEAI
ncbi:MAG: dephospho-CoA kinase [Eubacteriales bacterium]|nr:dephospho-CoA kinase [Eubacteriales bacterium]MDD3200222.1 dephospho-CoA kinase [Eubacteriales bacterium]MDD4122639.1 dephospho-CoA kinase [Eubacteriales bacterium]MDD4630471.1 dephospho-CoA kinase [Eubacteriales bacterium]